MAGSDSQAASNTVQDGVGVFIDACKLDLPENDVVESIDFERFFQLNLHYGEIQGPATLAMADMLNKPVEMIAPQSSLAFRNVPLSSDQSAWKSLNFGTPDTPALHSYHKAKGKGELGPSSSSELGSMSLALYLPFRQEWKLLGYSRGRLVNSFTLGPQEEQTIEIFKWDRLTTKTDSSTSFDSEQSNETSNTRRDTTDVTRDITRQTGFETNSQGKVGFTVGVANVDISTGFNARVAVNDAEKSTRSTIVEATGRATSHVRVNRTLKVVETRESGKETRITRHLKNANNCHALTIAFMEILATYKVSTFMRPEQARLVLLIKSSDLDSLSRFDRRNIRAHEQSLRLALLDKSMLAGFESARFLDARDRACAILCKGCNCNDVGSTQTSGAEWTNLENAVTNLLQIVNSLRNTNTIFPLSIPGAILNQAGDVKDIKRHLFLTALQSNAPRLLTDLAGIRIGGSVTSAQVEAIEQVLSGISGDAMAKLAYDKDVSTKVYWEIFAAVFAVITHEPISAAAITEIVRNNCGHLDNYDDGGLLGAIGGFNSSYQSWHTYLQAQIEKDEKAAELQRIAKEERELRVLDAFPLRETADAEERLEALLDHLNDPRNIDHYRFAVWNERSGATDPKLMALALAGFIEPTPVGMVGDQLAVPVKMTPGSKLTQFFNDSMEDLVKSVTKDEHDYILPTPAIYAESILGSCSACEPDLVRDMRLDMDHKDIENKILGYEADRLKARLHETPPLLDKEFPPESSLRVDVHSENSNQPTS